MRHKYHVGPKDRRTRDTFWGRHCFDSIKEARYYDGLELARREGMVVTFVPQVSFILPGGVRYRADFWVFRADGTSELIDVKGMRTESYRAKKRLVEDVYRPITITEV